MFNLSVYVTYSHGKPGSTQDRCVKDDPSVNTWSVIASNDNTLQPTICCSACQGNHFIACAHNMMSRCCWLVNTAQWIIRSATSIMSCSMCPSMTLIIPINNWRKGAWQHDSQPCIPLLGRCQNLTIFLQHLGPRVDI